MSVRRAGWLALLALLVLLGAVLLAVRPQAGATAFTLHVGDCFDVPAADAVGDVTEQPCTAPHDGEVFDTEDYPTPSGPAAYPGADAIQAWLNGRCLDTAFPAYVGQPYGSRPDLKVAYLYPQADAWAQGERRVTCYLELADGSRATTSYRGGTPSGS